MMTQTQTPIKRSPLSLDDRVTIAEVLTWDTYQEVRPEEVITIWMKEEILWVLLTANRAVPIHKETFKSILAAQRQQQAQSELNQYIETQAQEVAPEIEIDRTEEGVHRVWLGLKLIGTYYYFPRLDKWEVEPSIGRTRRCKTAEQALTIIIKPYQQKRRAA